MPNEKHNRVAWDKLSNPNCPWSVPVSAEEMKSAKAGSYTISVAGNKSVPPEWLGDIHSKSVLCLASGGGQQAPILAAAGANVTLVDISDNQLELDRNLCSEHLLDIDIIQGSMTALTMLGSSSFDFIVNPVSTSYVADLKPVWSECYRVLKENGRLISGSVNPLNFLFEENQGQASKGLTVINSLPYVESETLSETELKIAIERGMVFTWSHSLEDIIQGQISAGFFIAGFLEPKRNDARAPSINRFSNTYLSTLAIKQESINF